MSDEGVEELKRKKEKGRVVGELRGRGGERVES